MNCRQALKHLYEVIDKEANERNVQEVERHLKMCRHCMAQYEFEKMLHTVVRDKGKNEKDVTRVKQNILDKLDSIDASGEGQSPRVPFKWHIVAIATAAVVILCVITAISLSGFNDTQTADSEPDNSIIATAQSDSDIPYFIAAHQAHSNGINQSQGHSDPLNYLFEMTGIRIEHSSDLPIDNIHSVSVDTIMGIPFGCIEMLNPQNQLVTLFVTTSDKYNLPNNPIAVIDGREMLVHRCEKCTLVGIEKKDLIYMVVAGPKCEPKELVEIASFF
ncbi:MAG: zf-HC2 domain-containing protein [candidate division Zixibacteria bacterium]|nr:zf-HC2 domain-containing protein [candidate division Zixibacteria bacterium]